MSKLKTTLVVSFLFVGLIANSQHTIKTIELSKLKIERDELVYILDSMIIHEKRCEYYDSNLVFGINIRKSDSNYFINIQSENDKNIVLGLKPYGYTYYQNHLFFVSGDYNENLFQKSGEKKIFKYLKYNILNTNEKKERVKYTVTDDSFTIWWFWYINEKFFWGGKASYCE